VRQLPDLASGASEAAPAIEVVVGEGIARELNRDRPAAALQAARNPQRLDVGDAFSLGGRQWLVAGVMKSAGSTFDSEVWAKRSIIGPMFGKETYTSLVLRATDGPAAERLKNYLNLEYKKAAVQALLEEEYFASLSQTNRQFLVAVIFVAVVMAIGGVFGVMNTMFAAISQRTKDIGVLRLLGFARWQILVSFLIESLVIGLVGGLLGCALGSLCDGWTANSIVSSGQGGAGKFVVLVMTVDAETLIAGVLLSAVMAILGGFLPAVSAIRLRPLEALK
jgi:ABC-type antimicrobial peptide transport system permease subunit